MPDEKELVEIIKEEVKPFKEEMKNLKEQASNYENNNTELLSKLESKSKEAANLVELKETLARENQAKTALVEKLKKENETLKLENITLKKQMVPLKKEYLALKEKHTRLLEKLPILENRIKLAEIELKNKLTASVEKHLKEIVPAAFNRAQRVFEAKFQPIETDVLKEIGSLVGPYLSEERNVLTEKITNLEKTLTVVKEQSNKQIDTLEDSVNENKKLKAMLKEAKERLDKVSLDNYKAKLMEKAPAQIKTVLSEKLKNETDKEKCKTLFLETVKRSTAVKELKTNHPVAEIKVSKMRPQSIKKTIAEDDVTRIDEETLKLLE